MKAYFTIPVTVLVSVGLLGFMHTRTELQVTEEKQSSFVGIKLRVTQDVLQEYLAAESLLQNQYEESNNVRKALEEAVNAAQAEADQAKGSLDVCRGEQKSATDHQALEETKLNERQGETNKEAESWKAEFETLQKQLSARSPVCDFLKPGATEGSKLCGPVKAEAPKEEKPKEEAPKQEEPKPEAPKQEEPKPEAPKQEEPKAEAPKPEEPQVEAPKKR